MGFILNFQTIASAMAKKIRLYTLVIEIFATDRQDAAISPMTTGPDPGEGVLQVNIVLKFCKVDRHDQGQDKGDQEGTNGADDPARDPQNRL